MSNVNVTQKQSLCLNFKKSKKHALSIHINHENSVEPIYFTPTPLGVSRWVTTVMFPPSMMWKLRTDYFTFYYSRFARPTKPNVLLLVCGFSLPTLSSQLVDGTGEGGRGTLGDPHPNLWLTCGGGDSISDSPPEDRSAFTPRSALSAH